MTALFKAADDALYAAKDAGRNNAVLFTRTLLIGAPATR
jgi:PleD family two-component response regulator